MRIWPWVLAGMLPGVGSTPLADATALYPEDAAAMHAAWVRATSHIGRTERPGGEPGTPRPRCPSAGIEGGLAPAACCRLEPSPVRTP